MFRMWRHYPGFRLLERHTPDYIAEIRDSVFCLSTMGWGWGGRTKAAVLNGCIPVIIQPDVKVEFEEQVRWDERGARHTHLPMPDPSPDPSSDPPLDPSSDPPSDPPPDPSPDQSWDLLLDPPY